MLIHDDTYGWEGFGGKFRLASGQCRLRIFDLSRGEPAGTTFLKPMIVVVSDIGSGSATVKSSAGHLATCVTRDFDISPNRMHWVEYYPRKTYGVHDEHIIPARYEVVEFSWHGDKAIYPKWRPLNPPILDKLKELLLQSEKAARSMK